MNESVAEVWGFLGFQFLCLERLTCLHRPEEGHQPPLPSILAGRYIGEVRKEEKQEAEGQVGKCYWREGTRAKGTC